MLNIIGFYSGGRGGNLRGSNLRGDTREEGKGGRGQKKENEKMFFYPSLWLRQIFTNRLTIPAHQSSRLTPTPYI